MSAVDTVNVRAASILRDVTLHVKLKGLRVLRMRIWLGTKLVMLAALVMGCNIDIEQG